MCPFPRVPPPLHPWIWNIHITIEMGYTASSQSRPHNILCLVKGHIICWLKNISDYVRLAGGMEGDVTWRLAFPFLLRSNYVSFYFTVLRLMRMLTHTKYTDLWTFWYLTHLEGEISLTLIYSFNLKLTLISAAYLCSIYNAISTVSRSYYLSSVLIGLRG